MITPIVRANGGPSPYDYAVHVFHSVLNRNPIRELTKGSAGIYCWVNNLNGKCYVGKSVYLYSRLSQYYQWAYITKHIQSSLICRAIDKYGIDSFSLVILETNSMDLAQSEQDWINLLSPEYNSQQNVLVPFKGQDHIRPDRFGANNSFFNRKHSDAAKETIRLAALARLKSNKPGLGFTIIDTLLSTTTSYPSIRKGVEAMGWDQGYIMNRIKKGVSKPYLRRYLMKVNSSSPRYRVI